MGLEDYLTPLRRWWWLILLATAAAAAVSFVVVVRQPRAYRARTTLMIGQTIDNPNPSGAEFWLTQQLAQTYSEIATLDAVRDGTMETLGLLWLPEYTVRVIPETQLIEIAVVDTIPRRAQAVANELANQLILQSPTSPEREDQSRQQFVEAQLDALEVSITETGDEISARQSELAAATGAREIADLQNQIAALQNKQNTLRSNFATLFANTRQGSINNLNVIQPATLPTTSISANIWLTVVLAAVVGFGLASGAAYLLEYLDDSVKTEADVGRAGGLATLAGIARIEDEAAGGPLVALNEPRAPISEAYRVLRTGIQFSSIDNPDRARLLVTSANPGEGKSVTAANLGVVFAQAGYTVLIIDADLRKPVQHQQFNLDQNRGLTSFLLEMSLSAREDDNLAALKRVIQPTPVPGLHVLTSGPIPPNPSELLGSAKMEVMLHTAAVEYDYVLLDSPPVLAVTDSVVLSRRSDGVLVVVQAGVTRRGHLKQALSLLQAGNARILGAVLNRLSPRAEGYQAYHYYRSAYYQPDEGRGKRKAAANGKGARRASEEPAQSAAAGG